MTPASDMPLEAMTQIVADRIRSHRRAKEWSVRRLAEECARLGASHLSAPSLTNIERNQDAVRSARPVSAPELAIIARALGVAPVVLAPFLGSERCGECDGAPPVGFTCNACGASR